MTKNKASKEKAIYILANIWEGMRQQVRPELTGNEQLLEALKRVCQENEQVFTVLSWAYHYDLRLMAEYPPSIPSVIFLNLSISGIVIPDEIISAKRKLPCAVFVLYGDETEFSRCLEELPNEWKDQFTHYYSLKKSMDGDQGKFDKQVREILDEAISTSIKKRDNAPQFYTAFISYSHQDKDFAKWLYNNLKNYGIKCWLDEKELVAGDKIHSRVAHAIQERDKILLCASKHSLSSWWVDNEINSAIAKEQLLWKKCGMETLVLIPLNLDNFIFSDEWENGWKNQIISRIAPDFTLWKDYVYLDSSKDFIERLGRLQAFEKDGKDVTGSIRHAEHSLVRALVIQPEKDQQGFKKLRHH